MKIENPRMRSKEKKRSKKASQGRKKKKDRSRSRKRSSRKMRRSEDSYSESDDDSLSLSSSSSEEDGRRRRSRLQVGKDGKARKRRARSSSSGSDGGFGSPHAKKMKRSKRKVEGGRKKAGKKSRRAVSVSSESSDESDYEKSRGRSKKKELSRRYGKKDIKKEKGRYGSRVSSSSSASENERKGKRRLSPSRSSLSMSSGSQSGKKRKRYWSPSGSSLSGSIASGNQHIENEIMEVPNKPTGKLDQHIENEIMEVQNKPARKLSSIVVVPMETNLLTISEEHENDYAARDEYDERGSELNLVQQGQQIKEHMSSSRTEAAVSVPDNEDLESILRRKALENLKKFRGRPKKAEKSNKAEMSVEEVKQLPEPEKVADQLTIGGPNMKDSLSFNEDPGLIVEDSSKDVDLVSTLKKEEFSAAPSGSIENARGKNQVETELGDSESVQLSEVNKVLPKAAAVRIVDDSSPTLPADKKSNTRDDSADRNITVSQPGRSNWRTSNIKPESDPSLATDEPLAASCTKEPKLSPQEPLNAPPELSKCSSDKSGKIAPDEVKPKSVSDNIKEADTTFATPARDNPSSSLTDTVAGSEHESFEHHQAEAEAGSQFQEKTMSVMRGGELVQVSYKVYIPKKPPAVARRRLRR